jgi:hypothetical protein
MLDVPLEAPPPDLSTTLQDYQNYGWILFLGKISSPAMFFFFVLF